MIETLVGGIYGLIVGSFLNVVILRRSVRSLGGFSGCLSCKHPLAWYDLVPVLSWIILLGRCRYCKSRISIQYPLVELTTGVLFALLSGAGLAVPILLLSLIIAALLVLIAAYDLRHTIIPDEWAYAFAFLALVVSFMGILHVGANQDLVLLLLSGPACALPIFALWVVSRGTWMGLGDAKFALGMGWLLGIGPGLYALMLSFIIGALVSVCILLALPRIMYSLGITRFGSFARGFTMRSEVPFGPFLILGTCIVWLTTMYGIALPL